VLEANTFIPFDDILAYLRGRTGLIDAVVVSGGEPTLMGDLKEKITKLKEMGFLIKLDTNGTNPEVIKDLYESHLIDYVAMDIKNSFEKYPLTVGMKVVDLNKIKESINYLMTSGIDYEFRTTLIEEFHNEEDIKKIGELIKGAKRLYLQKYVDRESCIEHGFHEIKEETVKKYKDILLQYVNKVELRGY
jgi:pyruvate formate lyase activating enzyme